MADCERLNVCPFFAGSMQNMPRVAEMMKKRYCLEDKTACARYMLASAGIAVPKDLFPHDLDRARMLLCKS